MKIKRILSVLCATVMIVTIVASLFMAKWDYQQSIEMDDKLGAAMTPVFWLTLIVPVLFGEYDVFRIVSYFISEKQERKIYKSVLNLSTAAVITATVIDILLIYSDIWESNAGAEEIILFGLFGLYFVIKLVHLIMYAAKSVRNMKKSS